MRVVLRGLPLLLTLAWLSAAIPIGDVMAEEEVAKRVLIVSGPSTHPPGTHETAASARMFKHLLENLSELTGKELAPFRVDIIDQWPSSVESLGDVATVVFVGDMFPPVQLPNSQQILSDLAQMTERGCGIVCLHFATGLRSQHLPDDGDHPLLRWIGGYFSSGAKHHQSVAKVVSSTLSPTTVDHPLLRGWGQFSMHDEPYWNNYFGPDGPAKNVTILATAMVPPDAPKPEPVAWCVERADGGRGVGIVFPHFYRNWLIDDVRTLALNSILWTAKVDIPASGVQTPKPDLSAFAPDSVEPVKRN